MFTTASSRTENDVKATGAFDFLEDYKGTTSIICGTILILFGMLSTALGLASICTLASGHSIAYGIWCGILFCVSGVLCVFAGYKKSVCLVVLTGISCILTCLLAIVQIALAIAAAQNDSPSYRQNMLIRKQEKDYLKFDIYYKRNTAPKYICSNPNNPFTWKESWAPVDVLLILCGFIVFFVSLVASCLTCLAVNKGPRLIRSKEGITKSQEVFGNEMYYTERKR